jgi:hypothetical protein
VDHSKELTLQLRCLKLPSECKSRDCPLQLKRAFSPSPIHIVTRLFKRGSTYTSPSPIASTPSLLASCMRAMRQATPAHLPCRPLECFSWWSLLLICACWDTTCCRCVIAAAALSSASTSLHPSLPWTYSPFLGQERSGDVSVRRSDYGSISYTGGSNDDMRAKDAMLARGTRVGRGL